MTPKDRLDFHGASVLSLESRRGQEMAKLISSQGGVPIVVTSMREVPLEDNHEGLHFAQELIAGRVHVVLLLTGGGTRLLLRIAENANLRDALVAALKQVPVVARGLKPVAVLNEIGLRPTITVPEPNTWHELLEALDRTSDSVPIAGRTVAVQEYGKSNDELLQGIEERGGRVLRVPVYDWRLPEDTGPLRSAAQKLAADEVDVLLFTTSVQVRHLLQVAADMGLEEAIRRACDRMVLASIGPVTSEELRSRGFSVDLEPSHPKMGFLVKEAAEQSAAILARKRGS